MIGIGATAASMVRRVIAIHFAFVAYAISWRISAETTVENATA
jgi:hypothetical protein